MGGTGQPWPGSHPTTGGGLCAVPTGGAPPKAFSPSSCPGVSVGTQAGPGGEGLEGLGVSLPLRQLLQELDSSP